MIRFFRKFRQQLLADNRFSKYLVYAAGEIVLVVIGILIALQINNWNEQRKLENKLTDYIISLSQEIRVNQEVLASNMERVKGQILTGLHMLDSLNNQSVPDDHKDTYLLEKVGRLGPLRLQPLTTTSLDEIINTGSYSSIISGEVKDNLLAYQSALENVHTSLKRFEDYWQNIEQPYLTQHFSIADMLTNRNEKRNEEDRELLGDNIPDFNREQYLFSHHHNAFFQNREYSSMLTARYFDLRSLVLGMIRLDKAIDQLGESIE